MKEEKITFGAGCFWHVEAEFKKLKGVLKTTVGYMGGDDKKYPNPTYKQVCSNKTGFVEVCEVIYDSDKISLEELLEAFWNMHNPTQKNRQGMDIGKQYQSSIFYENLKQKKIAEKSLREEQERFRRDISTAIRKAGKFYRAEDYHQNYLDKNHAVCGI